MPFEIVPSGTHIDFIRYARVCAVLSVLAIAAGVAAIPVNGVRFGIDFAGGTEVQVHFVGDEEVGEGHIREIVTKQGVEEPSVVRYGGAESREYLIRFKTESEGDTGEFIEQLRVALVEGIGPLEVDRVEFVGPKVGGELREDGVRALALAGLMILIYVAFRFSLRFAPGAIVALLHDVLITSGLWVILGFEFDLRVLAALLAIVGYSLNDTIIVYDRIRENMEIRTKQDLPEVLNLSVNQVLSRTVLTSGTTLVALLALLVVGGQVIQPFAVAMAFGVLIGTYSSIYIAAPTLLLLERWLGAAPSAGTAPAKRAATRKRA